MTGQPLGALCYELIPRHRCGAAYHAPVTSRVSCSRTNVKSGAPSEQTHAVVHELKAPFAIGREDGLGMELNCRNGQRLVLDRHHHIELVGRGRDLENLGYLDGVQRMIAT